MDDPRILELLEQMVEQLERVDSALDDLKHQGRLRDIDIESIKDSVGNVETGISSIDFTVQTIETTMSA